MSQPEQQLKFALHLCAFAQDTNGLLTIVGAGANVHAPGTPLYLAGFISGAAAQFRASDLVIEILGADYRSELTRVQPPSGAVLETADEVRMALAFDMRDWDVTDLPPGEYEVRVSIGEDVDTLRLFLNHPQLLAPSGAIDPAAT